MSREYLPAAQKLIKAVSLSSKRKLYMPGHEIITLPLTKGKNGNLTS